MCMKSRTIRGRTAARFGALALCFVASSSCMAMTAKDVTEKMTKEARFNYLGGLLEMQIFQTMRSGNTKAAQCMRDNYFPETGGKDDAWAKLYDALDQFPDKQATAIVYLLTQKICGG